VSTASGAIATGYRDGYIHVRGQRLHYVDYGGDGEALVGLHGLIQNAHAFDAIAPILVPHVHLFSFDLRGRGDSDWGPPERYTWKYYMADLVGLLAELGLSRFALIGSSLGGLLALMYGIAHPDRVTRLVLNDIALDMNFAGLLRATGRYAYVPLAKVALDHMSPTAATPAAPLPAPQASDEQIHAAVERLSDEEVDALLSQMLNEEIDEFANLAEAIAWFVARRDGIECLDDEARAAWVSHYLTPTPSGGLRFNCDPAVRDPNVMASMVGAGLPWSPGRRGWEQIKRLTMPVLILRGALSDVLLPESAERLAQWLPDARWLEVPGAGHSPTLYEPEARAALRDFFGADLSDPAPLIP